MKKIYLILLLTTLLNFFAYGQENTCGITDPNQFQGAYHFSDGHVVSIVPSFSAGQWRITDFKSGKSHKLHSIDTLNFQSAGDWESETPIAFRYRFNLDKNGLAESLTIKQNGKKDLIAKKIKFREQTVKFKSGDIELFGKLTLPMNGKTPFKTVVMVHGSDQTASVDREWFPHLLAANGIAAFVFDKRGTGCSKGTYTQHFGILSDDVVAAVNSLKTIPEIDKNRIGLAGYSQGGWVAPLAASKDSTVKFVLVAYGMAMSVADEDRLEAPLKLKELGFDADSIAQFEDLNSELHQVAKDNFTDWQKFDEKVARYKETKWFAALKGTQTWLGFVLAMGIEQTKIQMPQMFKSFFQPFYDPVPTLESLKIPILWLIAEKDIEAPPELTIEVLKRLRKEGKPFETVVFPHTNHGITEFVVKDKRRITTKYASNYFSTMVKWIKEQN